LWRESCKVSSGPINIFLRKVDVEVVFLQSDALSTCDSLRGGYQIHYVQLFKLYLDSKNSIQSSLIDWNASSSREKISTSGNDLNNGCERTFEISWIIIYIIGLSFQSRSWYTTPLYQVRVASLWVHLKALGSRLYTSYVMHYRWSGVVRTTTSEALKQAELPI